MPDDLDIFAGDIFRVWILVVVEVVHRSRLGGKAFPSIHSFGAEIEEIGWYWRAWNRDPRSWLPRRPHWLRSMLGNL